MHRRRRTFRFTIVAALIGVVMPVLAPRDCCCARQIGPARQAGCCAGTKVEKGASGGFCCQQKATADACQHGTWSKSMCRCSTARMQFLGVREFRWEEDVAAAFVETPFGGSPVILIAPRPVVEEVRPAGTPLRSVLCVWLK